MKQIHRSFAAAFLFLATAMSGTPAVRAQTAAPVPAATIINSVPYTITAPGFYQLGANLIYNGNASINNDAIITVNANNVTLDLGGHYLSGPSTNAATTLYGIYANGEGNLTIQNGTISHCLFGVYLTGSTDGTTYTNFNQTIRNLLVTHCYSVGIYLFYPTNSQVNNCQVSFIGGTAVTGYAGDAQGIDLNGTVGPGCQVSNNTVTSVTAGSGQGTGIIAYSCSILGNAVDTVTGSQLAAGIYSGHLLVGNRVSNCTYGFYNPGKYQNNLTYNCTTPFEDGTTDAGGNN